MKGCVEAAAGAPVHAGVLAPGLGDAIPGARDFKAAGADGIMPIVPHYAGLTHSLPIDYVRTIRDRVDLPILCYDNPARSRFVVRAETIARLAEDRTIFGMKASSTDLHPFDNVLRSVGPEFAALIGWHTPFAQQVALRAALRLIGIDPGRSPLPVPPASGALGARPETVLKDLRSAGTIPSPAV